MLGPLYLLQMDTASLLGGGLSHTGIDGYSRSIVSVQATLSPQLYISYFWKQLCSMAFPHGFTQIKVEHSSCTTRDGA